MTNKKIMFTHIVKTGGMSVKKFFRINFGDNYKESFLNFENSFLSIEQTSEIYSGWKSNYKYYADHKLSFFITRFFSGIKNFTIVRDPVDRFISFYNFINNQSNNNFFANNIKGAIHNLYVEHNNLKGADQIYHLSKGHGFKIIRQCVNELDYLVIPFEYISDIPTIFGSSKEMLHKNKSGKIIDNLDTETKNLIEKYTEGDKMLHEWATERYEKNRDNILEKWADWA